MRDVSDEARGPARTTPVAVAPADDAGEIRVVYGHRSVTRALLGFCDLLRGMCALYLAFLAVVHVAFEQLFGVYGSELFPRWNAGPVGAVLMAAALMMLYPVLLRCECRCLGRCRRRTRRRRRSFIERIDSIIGVRGSHFGELLVASEVVEIAAQTQVLFDIAESGFSRSAITSYGAILCVNCVVTPLVLLSDNIAVHRDMAVIADSCFDMIYALLWPLLTLVAVLADVLACDGVVTDHEQLVSVFTIAQFLLVESLLELLVRLVPFVSAHVLLGEVSRVLQSERRPEALYDHEAGKPQHRRWKRRYRALGLALGVAYAATIAVVVGSATTDRCAAEPMCTRQAYPLLSDGECACTVVQAGCDGPIDAGELDAAIDRVASTLLCIDVTGYGLAELPPSLARADELWWLRANRNELRNATGLVSMDSLLTAELNDNRLTELPELPASGSAVVLLASHNRFTQLPEAPSGYDNLRALDVHANAIVGEVPCAFTELPLARFTISSNNLTALPGDGCSYSGWEAELRLLNVANNAIEGPLPSQLFSLDDSLELHLPDNPVCSSGHDLPSEANCEPGCSVDCAPFYVGDSYCHEFLCNTEECGWDGGDCSGKVC